MHSHSSGDWSTVRDQPGPKDPGLQYKKAMAGSYKITASLSEEKDETLHEW
jgi:hypothetical protein